MSEIKTSSDMNESNVGKSNIGISFIVPCYNISAYFDRLSRCIEHQLSSGDCGQIEFILINDGSTDDTLIHLRHLQSRYPCQVIVIDQPNMGVSAARNAGIEQAQREFIGFLDSDDLLMAGAVSTLLKTISADDVDVLIFDFDSVTDPSQIPSLSSTSSIHTHYQGDLRAYYLTFTPIVVWRMLYRTSLIKDNNILFPSITIGEDTLFNFSVFMLGGRVKHIDSVLYYHIDRECSLSSSVDAPYVRKIIASVLKMQEAYNTYLLTHEESSAIISKINEHRKRQVRFVFDKLITSASCFTSREIRDLRLSLEHLGAFPIAVTSMVDRRVNFHLKHPFTVTCLYYLHRIKRFCCCR